MDTTTRTKLTFAGVALAGVIAGGAVIAMTLPIIAEAASTPSAGTDSNGTDSDTRGGHEANGITEEPLTGDVAAQVEAAVLAEYPDASIQRLETDAEGAAYEAHIVQADGTPATVKLDEDFNILGLEDGRGDHRDSDEDDPFGTAT
jgi:hypothetical protein